MVPVAYTYERVIEDYSGELMGKRKVRESVWRVFCGLVEGISGTGGGNMRLDFGTPIKLSVCCCDNCLFDYQLLLPLDILGLYRMFKGKYSIATIDYSHRRTRPITFLS